MPFGNRARSVRAYTYGAAEPVAGRDEAIEQHRLRTNLWNGLVALERARREAREVLLAPHVAGDDDAERRASRRAAFRVPEVKEALHVLDHETYEATKPLYQQSGCYWGNYLDVITAWQVACKGLDVPRFHRFVWHDGKTAVRWPKGLPVARAWGQDTQLQIVPVDPAIYDSRRARRHGQRTMLRVRVRSEARRPVWLELPIYLHRPLPEDGLIRQVHVTWQRIGTTRLRWSVSLVVEVPEREIPRAEREERPAVALDLCWRRRPDGLRVAYALGEDGTAVDLMLPNGWLGEMARVDDLRSLRDQHLNAFRAALTAWVDAAPGIPEWLREERRAWGHWRAPARFAAMVLRWRDAEHRFSGDETGYSLAETWRQRDKHLAEYEAHLRDQLLTQRRERYRVFAAGLARDYGRVVLEDFDLRAVARLDQGGAELHAPARHQRVMAATSILRGAVLNAARREGVEVVEIPAAYTTQTCADCGQPEPFDAAVDLEHTCSHCGARWDQDRNACANLLGLAWEQRVRA